MIRLCWADKVALLWMFVVYFGLFLISNDKAAAFGFFGSFEGMKMLLIIILPVWVILRLIDWIGNGPQRRKRVVRARIID